MPMFPQVLNCQESNQTKSSPKLFSSDIEFRWERETERNKKGKRRRTG